MNLHFSKEKPDTNSYCQLRIDAGMTPKSIKLVEKSLDLSLFITTISDEKGKLIAMGRVIGDYTSMQIVDIIVSPEYQGRKLGSKIMNDIMNIVREYADPSTFVNLFADVDFLYHKYGFIVPQSTKGMMLNWKDF